MTDNISPHLRRYIRPGIMILCLVWILGLSMCDLLLFNHTRTISLFGDQVHYDGMARLLLTHHVYNYWLTPSPSAMAMPGYPIFLAIIYKIVGLAPNRLEYVWVAQFVLYLVSVYLMYRLGRRMQSRLLGAILAAVLATLPFIFNEPFRVLTENLAIPAFLLYLNVFYETYSSPLTIRRWAVLGLCLGIMALIRPGLAELGLVPLIVLIKRMIPEKRWDVFVAFLVCCALPLIPWWIRNLVTFHQFILFDRGEAANTILAGTYPGYTSGPPSLNLAGVDQMALARQRIIQGFSHEPLKYFLWFTVWRFHYNFDYIYLPYLGSMAQRFKFVMIQYQRVIVWASIAFTVFLLMAKRQFTKRNPFLMLLVYSNIILIIMLIPFHPEPRFAIYSVLLFGIVLIVGLYKLLSERNQAV